MFAPLIDTITGRSSAWSATSKAAHVTLVDAITGIPSGGGYVAQTSATRPADTTPYTAGDVVGATAAAYVFTSMGVAGGRTTISDVDLRMDIAAVPAGMTSFRLHLYNATPPSALADNAVWDLPAGDRAAYLGYVDVGSPVDVGSTLFVQTNGAGSKTVQMGATTSLWGYLVTNGGFTPSSAAVTALRLVAQGG